jgi:thiamine-phosphate diphosphorylase
VKLRGLYAITPEGPGLEAKVRAALEGGIAVLQYRRKQGDAAEARRVAALAREFGVPLVVNDDIALALELDAAGAHLGRDDGDLRDARRRRGQRLLGVS